MTFEVGEGPVGVVLLEFRQGGAAGGDGEDFGADGATAPDVEGGIADYDNFLALQRPLQEASGTIAGNGGDLIALFMVIGKSAGLEEFPQAEVAQFDLRAQADVASQKAKQGRFGKLPELVDEGADARAFAGFTVPEDLVEPEDVTIKEPAEIICRGRDSVHRKKLAHKAEIGASGEFEAFEAVGGAKLHLEDFGESFDTGAAGADEGAVDVEKDEADHIQGRKQ